jgi:hypothetical protein
MDMTHTRKFFINSFNGRHVVFEQLARGCRAVSKEFSSKEEAMQVLLALRGA